MTYLEALRRKLGVETIDEVLEKIVSLRDGVYCPYVFDLGASEACLANDDKYYWDRTICLRCWARQAPGPVVLEEVETIYPCTVQILRNPKTGEESVGWFRGEMDG